MWYLNKKWVMKLIFYMQMIVWSLMGMVNHSLTSQNNKFAMSSQYRKKKKKKRDMELIFCMKINIKVSWKLIWILWASKVIVPLLKDMIKHSQSTEVTSLQYLIKKLGTEFIFCMQINTIVSTSLHYCFDGSGLTCPKYLKRKLVILLEYCKIKVS